MSTDDLFKTSAKAAVGKAPEILDPLNVKMNPHGVRIRESRDSADNPRSTPIIVAFDVTGSMGRLATYMAQTGLGVLFQSILDRKPVSDPHIMAMAVGDAKYDRAPLQVSEFEADNKIIAQLENFWIEHGGGGNGWESYNLPWYFAANHTAIDSLEKRGEKGLIFTVGDEFPPPELQAEHVKRFIGDTLEADMTSAEVLALAERMYHVFHVVVEEGDHCRHHGADKVVARWLPLLGERVLRLSDHTKLSEVIVSAIQVIAGADPDAVAASWSGDTSLVVSRAVGALKTTGKSTAVAPIRF